MLLPEKDPIDFNKNASKLRVHVLEWSPRTKTTKNFTNQYSKNLREFDLSRKTFAEKRNLVIQIYETLDREYEDRILKSEDIFVSNENGEWNLFILTSKHNATFSDNFVKIIMRNERSNNYDYELCHHLAEIIDAGVNVPEDILKHPFFYSKKQRLDFVKVVYNKYHYHKDLPRQDQNGWYLNILESTQMGVDNWQDLISPETRISLIGRYSCTKFDLLRFIRHKLKKQKKLNDQKYSDELYDGWISKDMPLLLCRLYESMSIYSGDDKDFIFDYYTNGMRKILKKTYWSRFHLNGYKVGIETKFSKYLALFTNCEKTMIYMVNKTEIIPFDTKGRKIIPKIALPTAFKNNNENFELITCGKYVLLISHNDKNTDLALNCYEQNLELNPIKISSDVWLNTKWIYQNANLSKNGHLLISFTNAGKCRWQYLRIKNRKMTSKKSKKFMNVYGPPSSLNIFTNDKVMCLANEKTMGDKVHLDKIIISDSWNNKDWNIVIWLENSDLYWHTVFDPIKFYKSKSESGQLTRKKMSNYSIKDCKFTYELDAEECIITTIFTCCPNFGSLGLSEIIISIFRISTSDLSVKLNHIITIPVVKRPKSIKTLTRKYDQASNYLAVMVESSSENSELYVYSLSDFEGIPKIKSQKIRPNSCFTFLDGIDCAAFIAVDNSVMIWSLPDSKAIHRMIPPEQLTDIFSTSDLLIGVSSSKMYQMRLDFSRIFMEKKYFHLQKRDLDENYKPIEIELESSDGEAAKSQGSEDSGNYEDFIYSQRKPCLTNFQKPVLHQFPIVLPHFHQAPLMNNYPITLPVMNSQNFQLKPQFQPKFNNIIPAGNYQPAGTYEPAGNYKPAGNYECLHYKPKNNLPLDNYHTISRFGNPRYPAY